MNARITVIKKTLHMDIIQEDLPNLAAIAAPCSDLRDAQAFEVQDDHIACTEGFCAHAWKTIGPVVTRVCRGETLNGPDAFPPCADGLRPVTFHIEPIEDERTSGA